MSSVLPAPRPAPTATAAHATIAQVRSAVAEVIRGKDEIVELALVALVGRGHVLIEDIPGVGKSTLARTLAQTVGGEFRRIQFTNDLMPSDVVGTAVWRPDSGRFAFAKDRTFTTSSRGRAGALTSCWRRTNR